MKPGLLTAVGSPVREPGGREGRLAKRGVKSNLTFLDRGDLAEAFPGGSRGKNEFGLGEGL